jgi:hypothetical protein
MSPERGLGALPCVDIGLGIEFDVALDDDSERIGMAGEVCGLSFGTRVASPHSV